MMEGGTSRMAARERRGGGTSRMAARERRGGDLEDGGPGVDDGGDALLPQPVLDTHAHTRALLHHKG